MNENKDITPDIAAMPQGTADAVGVSAPPVSWYIAILNHRTEKAVAQRLTELGIENYLPVQEEIHLWKNGKKKKIDRVVIPAKIFIRCTEARRREIVAFPFIFRFMVNPAGVIPPGRVSRPLATVSDREIEQLKFMLGVPGVKVTFTESYVRGQKVRVIRGALKGLEGEIIKEPGGKSHRLSINIDSLGSASVQISATDVAPL